MYVFITDLTRESGLPGSFSISGSRSSLSSRDSRGRSPRDFDQSLDRDSPHLPRPRRHDLRDPRRLERKKVRDLIWKTNNNLYM